MESEQCPLDKTSIPTTQDVHQTIQPRHIWQFTAVDISSHLSQENMFQEHSQLQLPLCSGTKFVTLSNDPQRRCPLPGASGKTLVACLFYVPRKAVLLRWKRLSDTCDFNNFHVKCVVCYCVYEQIALIHHIRLYFKKTLEFLEIIFLQI